MPKHFQALTIVCAVLVSTPSPGSSQELPDLTITEIFMRPTPPDYLNQDIVFIGVKVRNNGADATGEVAVTCDFSCSGHSQRYISGMVLPDGLAARSEAILGDRSFVDVRGCFFVTQREFNCRVGVAGLDDANEADNAMSQLLVTGK